MLYFFSKNPSLYTFGKHLKFCNFSTIVMLGLNFIAKLSTITTQERVCLQLLETTKTVSLTYHLHTSGSEIYGRPYTPLGMFVFSVNLFYVLLLHN